MTMEEMSQQIAKLDEQLKAMEARAVKAERDKALMVLTPEQRQVFDALPAAKQEAYFAADEAARKSMIAEEVKAVEKGLNLPEAIQKQMAELRKRADETEVQNQELRKRFEAEETARKRTEALAVIKEQYGHTPGTDEEKLTAYLAVKALPEAQQKPILDAWAASEASVVKSMVPAGSSTATGSTDSSAWSKIEALAKKAVESGNGLTFDQAVTKVLETNHQLYAEYEAEQAKR